MGFFKRFKDYILPEQTDFFGCLIRQCEITEKIVEELKNTFAAKSGNDAELIKLIHEAKQLREKNLIELNRALITPVDKEALSRAYINMHWISLSVKHLNVEANAYGIKSLEQYNSLFELLQKQMSSLTESFRLLREKKYYQVLATLYDVIHHDNLLIEAYSSLLATLFEQDDIKKILQHKEILSQLKEVSKRIHFCANTVEDIVFKMN